MPLIPPPNEAPGGIEIEDLSTGFGPEQIGQKVPVKEIMVWPHSGTRNGAGEGLCVNPTICIALRDAHHRSITPSVLACSLYQSNCYSERSLGNIGGNHPYSDRSTENFPMASCSTTTSSALRASAWTAAPPCVPLLRIRTSTCLYFPEVTRCSAIMKGMSIERRQGTYERTKNK